MWPGVLAAAFLACRFSYDNPAERLEAGQVSGRTVFQVPELAPAPGISVSLKGSTFDQRSRDTGRFTVLPLPVGRHTLLFRDGLERASLRVVDVALGRDGQPEGVRVGDVDIPRGSSLRGTVAGTIALPPGVVVDEPSGLSADLLGARYQLDAMSAGDHLLKAAQVDAGSSQEWVGGPLSLSVDEADEGAVKRVAALQMRLATPQLGLLRFRVLSLSPDVGDADMTVEVEEALRGVLPGPFVPGADGVVEAMVPEGLYHVRLAPPAALAGLVPAPQPATGVVLTGERAEVGSLYLVPSATVGSAQALCVDDGDCGKGGGPCVAGACARYSPPPVVPASLPTCPARSDFCSSGSPCVTAGGFAGQCVAVQGAPAQACISCDSTCTPDGRTTLSAGCVF